MTSRAGRVELGMTSSGCAARSPFHTAPVVGDRQLRSGSGWFAGCVSRRLLALVATALLLLLVGAVPASAFPWARRITGYLSARDGTVNADLTDNETEWQAASPSTAGSLAYTTAPLPKTLVFYGPASADLWVSSTSSDADIQATITEVRPDGQEVYVQRGWLRLSNRAVNPALSTPLLPFYVQTKESQRPMPGGQPALARLEVEQFSHVFRRGSSIRIWLDTPSVTGEWGFSDPTTPSTIKIWHDPTHPTSLALGMLQIAGINTPFPVCNGLVQEPCRTNRRPIPPGTGPDGSTAGAIPVPPCLASRRITLTIPSTPRGAPIRSVEIYVDGKRRGRLVGRSLGRTVKLTLSGTGADTVKVLLVIRTAGRTIRLARHIRLCH